MKRSAGILLSVSSLPSKYGIGCFSEAAYKFVDWLKEAGQTYWQILPLGPTSYGDSPYQSFSTFAGNPYFISLEEFVNQGLLTREECNAADFESNIDKVDYEKLYKSRYALLHKAYEKCDVEKNADFLVFPIVCKNYIAKIYNNLPHIVIYHYTFLMHLFFLNECLLSIQPMLCLYIYL